MRNTLEPYNANGWWGVHVIVSPSDVSMTGINVDLSVMGTWFVSLLCPPWHLQLDKINKITSSPCRSICVDHVMSIQTFLLLTRFYMVVAAALPPNISTACDSAKANIDTWRI